MVFSFDYGVVSDNRKLGEVTDGPGESVEVDVSIPVILVDSTEDLLVPPHDNTLLISHLDVSLFAKLL